MSEFARDVLSDEILAKHHPEERVPEARIKPDGYTGGRRRRSLSGPFGIELTRVMEERGLSNIRLGMLAGYDHSYISRLRSDDRSPTRDGVLKLADALGLQAAERIQFCAAGGAWPWGRVPDRWEAAELFCLMDTEAAG